MAGVVAGVVAGVGVGVGLVCPRQNQQTWQLILPLTQLRRSKTLTRMMPQMVSTIAKSGWKTLKSTTPRTPHRSRRATIAQGSRAQDW